MKILEISPRSPFLFTGISNYVIKLTKSLNSRKIRADILSTRFRNENYEIIHSENFKIILVKAIQFLKYLKLFNENNPVCLVTPQIYTILKNYDIFHIHSYNYIFSLQFLIILKLMKKRTILSIHGGVNLFNYLHKKRSIKSTVSTIISKLIGHIQITYSDYIISDSKSDLSLINEVFYCKRKKNNFYIPNGVEIIDYNDTSYREFITFIGRLDHLKGFDFYLELIKKIHAKYNDIPFLIIGKGPYQYKIDTFDKTMKLFHYQDIDSNFLRELYLKSRILLFCSRTEGLPTVILESMLYKVPIVSNNIGDISDLIKHGDNGFLFNNEDVDEAFGFVDKILTDSQLANNFSQKSFQKVCDKFNWHRIVRLYEILFNRLGEN